MKTKILITTLAVILLSLSAWLIAGYSTTGNTEVVIKNPSNTNHVVSYFANDHGQWLNTPNASHSHSTIEASLEKNDFYHSADYIVAVGSKLDNFICTINIHEAALSSRAYVRQHQGNCKVESLGKHKLAITIGRQSQSSHHLV